MAPNIWTPKSELIGQVIAYLDRGLQGANAEVVNTVDFALRLLARGTVPIRRHLQDIDDAYSEYVSAGDPNGLVGPSGKGAARWLSGGQSLTYGIFFANESDASAPAQKVIVTTPLAANLDLASLQLQGINIPGISVPIPATFDPAISLYEAATTVDLRPTQNLLVRINAKLDPPAGC